MLIHAATLDSSVFEPVVKDVINIFWEKIN